MTTFTCIGPARGCNDIEHRSVEAAERYIARDQRRCARQGGYSDLEVYSRSPEQRAAGRAYLQSAGQPSGLYGHRAVNCTPVA